MRYPELSSSWFFSNITFLSLCFIPLFQKRGWPSPARRWIANPLILRSREFKSPSSRSHYSPKRVICSPSSRFLILYLFSSNIKCVWKILCAYARQRFSRMVLSSSMNMFFSWSLHVESKEAMYW